MWIIESWWNDIILKRAIYKYHHVFIHAYLLYTINLHSMSYISRKQVKANWTFMQVTNRKVWERKNESMRMCKTRLCPKLRLIVKHEWTMWSVLSSSSFPHLQSSSISNYHYSVSSLVVCVNEKDKHVRNILIDIWFWQRSIFLFTWHDWNDNNIDVHYWTSLFEKFHAVCGRSHYNVLWSEKYLLSKEQSLSHFFMLTICCKGLRHFQTRMPWII